MSKEYEPPMKISRFGKPQPINRKINAEWEQMLKVGYDAQYMSSDGIRSEHIDLNQPSCPHSQKIPNMVTIRRCDKLAYYTPVIVNGAVTTKNSGYPCPIRGWGKHFETCPYRGDE